MLPVFLLVASLASVEGMSEDHCLGYDVLCTTADYQLRRYNESVWVGIQGSWEIFHGPDMALLYHYFKGRNSEGMDIQLTGQVLASFTEHGAPTIYFILPEELWDNPPTATDPRVFVTRLPMMDVFAREIRQFRFSDGADFNRTLSAQNVHVNNSNFFVHSCFRDSRMFHSLPQGESGLMTKRTMLSVKGLLFHTQEHSPELSAVSFSQEIWFVSIGGFDCPAP